ncbi:hypothetical protein SUGI_0253210 [Cryptomeria japonica]|nr:hypothetical protein SUGI_0253210 [Cryptomeria japonica]
MGYAGCTRGEAQERRRLTYGATENATPEAGQGKRQSRGEEELCVRWWSFFGWGEGQHIQRPQGPSWLSLCTAVPLLSLSPTCASNLCLPSLCISQHLHSHFVAPVSFTPDKP